ncbi:hypothetical protein ACOSQ3_005787 [Xanthoceras sorbifolium]
MHRLDVLDERSSREGGRRTPRRREGIGDNEEEEEEAQLGGVKCRELRMVQGQPRDTDVRRNSLDELTKRMKVEVPDFMGRLDPDAFYDWITALEDYFDWFAVPGDRKVQFVKLKLKEPARVWWSSAMKERLESKYLSINYEQLIYEDMLQWMSPYPWTNPWGGT